ncbi:MAG: sulfatase-like hydrolase/transferase [Acidobacteria bacterium]|jgi:arylsulfatase A-like enzyme/Tfp pilus assembly protein PilF|nr:sulfatase-like hydrolase/transferase [Acidobacteriota bacterium]
MKTRKRTPDKGAKRRWAPALLFAALGLALLAALVALFGGAVRDRLQRRQLRGMNVLLITLDTLRADHLSCYDPAKVETPHLDALAAGGVLFENCVAQTPLTLPSHATILSGTYPFYHQVRDNRATRVPSGLPLLSEAFRAGGRSTAAFVGSMVLDSSYGLDRGFELYADRFSAYNPLNFWGEIRKPADAVLAEARDWISRRAREPFFAWIHLYDPHAPWEPPSPFRERYAGHPYRGSVAFMDSELGKFFSYLKESGLWSRSLIVVVADHGEGLGEHGEETHGFFVYQSTMRVPFLVHLPFAPPRQRLTQRVELTDVAPTILQAMGFAIPSVVQGHSLLDLILGRPARRPDAAYGESHYPRIHFGWSELKAFYQGRWKYILAPDEELYDLEADPGETRNLAAQRPEESRRLRSLLMRQIAGSGAPPLAAALPRLDADSRRKLASLGYVTTTVPRSAELSRIDPKNKIAVIESLRRIKELAEQGRWTEAGERARRILAADPQIGQARIASANAYRAAGDFNRAVDELRAGLAIQGDDDQMLALLGETLSLAGRFQESLAAFEGCLAVNPENPANQNNLGLAYWNLGQVDRAESAFREALGIDPDFVLARVNLGRFYLHARRDGRRAREALLAAVASDPGLASAHDALAESYAMAGSFARAAEHWSRCLELEPQNFDACFNLLMVYARKLPDRKKALHYYERIRRDFFPRLPEKERRAVEALGQGLN